MIDESKLLEEINMEADQDHSLGLSRCIPIRAIKEMVESQPQIKEWIPCSNGKNLPEEKINPVTNDFYEYQVTFSLEQVTDIRHYKFGNGHWWNDGQIMDRYVTAWRKPLEAYHE